MSVNLRRNVFTSANVNWLYPTLAFLLSFFAIAPLAFPGLFQSYTGYSAVYNLIDFDAHLSSFWTWTAVWGRAYDFWRMDGPLGYWLAELFHLAGFSFLNSIKAVYALSFFVSALGMFKLAQRIFQSDGAALLASALYIYFPAHIASVYVRAAFGEAVAWALFPLALWSLLALADRQGKFLGAVLACTGAFAGLMLAQAGMALLFGILATVWLLALGPDSRDPRKLVRAPALYAPWLGLALGFLIQLPALVPQGSISAADGFVPAFVYPFQMLTASWGLEQPRGNFMDAAPYQLGIGALGLTILAIALILRQDQNARDENPARRVVWFAVGASVVVLVLMLPLLEPLWNLVGLSSLVQYPSRLLAFVGLLLALAASSILVSDTRFQEIPLLAALVIVPILAVYPYLAPEFVPLSPTGPALARFNNDEIALLDAKIIRPPGRWRHGATVELDLTWQALRQPNRDYTVFMHIFDENGQPWGETDARPLDGTLSTLNWRPGQVVEDNQSVQIELAAPPEGFHMELGIYQSATGERALTQTGENFVRIDERQ